LTHTFCTVKALIGIYRYCTVSKLKWQRFYFCYLFSDLLLHIASSF